MTKEQGLRPSLPNDMDPNLKTLICECWQEDPELRPSFPVILLRLSAIKDRDFSSFNGENEELAVSDLCRSVNELFWSHASQKKRTISQNTYLNKQFTAVIDDNVKVTAMDPILQKVLDTKTGSDAIKILGWMMFGSHDRRNELCPEPVLDDDIIVNRAKSFALYKSTFISKGRNKCKGTDARKRITELACLEAALSSERWSQSLQKKSKADQKWIVAQVGEDLVHGKKKRRRRRNRRQTTSERTKKERTNNFLLATQYVRRHGTDTLHPSSKMKLLGLRMQALRGDCPPMDEGEERLLPVLKSLQRSAWLSVKGKGTTQAMEEYLTLLYSLVPNWKYAHSLEHKDPSKPTKMMWVIKIHYEFSQGLLPTKFASGSLAISAEAKVKCIEVLQSSNGTTSKIWNEDEVDPTNADRSSDPQTHEVKRHWPSPQEFTISECIIDKAKYSTIEEQRDDISKQLLMMARTGHDEEDGWEHWAEAEVPADPTMTGISVYEREVDWSPVEQLRSSLETKFTVEIIFEYLVAAQLLNTSMVRKAGIVEKLGVNEADDAITEYCLFAHKSEDRSNVTKLMYQEISFPWYVPHVNVDLLEIVFSKRRTHKNCLEINFCRGRPLSPRDVFIVQDYVLKKKGKENSWFFTLNHDVSHVRRV